MNIPIVEGISREKVGKGSAHRSRTSGYIPAIIYENTKNKAINIPNENMLEVLRNQGDSPIIAIKMGTTTTTALVKEIQRDPISGQILHIDFKPVDMNESIHVKVPVRFEGIDVLKKQGTVIQSQKNKIEIECKPDNMPKSINIDASKFKVGDSIKAKDVELAGEISIIGKLDSVIATITNTRKTEG